MPIEGDEYVELTRDEILLLLETELQTQFGIDIDLSDSSVFSTFADVQATVHANNFEPLLKELHDSAFLRTATGQALDDSVAILGFQRREAVKATGVVRFSREEIANKNYVIQEGTIVQTDDESPVRFETSESVSLKKFDGFESDTVSLYAEDVAEFGRTTAVSWTGAGALESSATGGMIYRKNVETREGDKNSCRVQLTTGARGQVYFHVDDVDNNYYLEADKTGEQFFLTRQIGGSGSILDSVSGLTIPTDEWLEVVYDCKVPNGSSDNIYAYLYNEAGDLLAELSANDTTYTSGGYGFGSQTAKVYFDDYSQYSVGANVTAVSGGATGNVGAATLTVLPVVPSGVESVTNPYNTGNSDYTDLLGLSYITGRQRETDEELRQRVQDSNTTSGKATIDAVAQAVKDVEGVLSVNYVENKDSVADGDGRPPTSFEIIVFGGDNDEIAQAIHDTAAGTAHDVGGYAGTLASGTGQSLVTGQTYTYEFSNPTEVAVDVTMDIVVTDEYIGDTALRNLIVDYIGGTDSDGLNVNGELGAGEDVIVDKVEDVIVGEDTGVKGIVSLSFTPVATTDGDGLDVVAISGTGTYEVATTNASDGSISITKTTV